MAYNCQNSTSQLDILQIIYEWPPGKKKKDQTREKFWSGSSIELCSVAISRVEDPSKSSAVGKNFYP